MNVVIAADALRREALGGTPARFKPWTRRWVEPWFNAIGHVLAGTIGLLPPETRRRFLMRLCRRLGGQSEESPLLSARRTQTLALAQEAFSRDGRWPALLVVTSHGETSGPLAWLRFEILRQGLDVANAVAAAHPRAGWGMHPQCLLAIDPYALDTIPSALAGVYAAAMHRLYLVTDRQPATQSWVQRRWLLRDSAASTSGFRLLRRLRQGVPVLMVLSGGLPHNARLLYGAREFLQSLKLPRWSLSKREAERQLLELMKGEAAGHRPAETGEIAEGTLRALQSWLEGLGVPATSLAQEVRRFQQEFRPAVARRERLWRVLGGRLVGRGQSVILLPISHRPSSLHVKVHSPSLWRAQRRLSPKELQEQAQTWANKLHACFTGD